MKHCRYWILAGLLAVVMATLGFAREARAALFPACSATDIINATGGACPSDPNAECLISDSFFMSKPTCLFDFGTRAVTITRTGEVLMNEATVTFMTGSFTVASGGRLDGTGGQGGELTVISTGSITVEKSGPSTGSVLLGGLEFGGEAIFLASGNIVVNGDVKANNLSPDASGGGIAFSAGGDIVIGSQSSVDVRGGPQEFGGTLDLVAGGRIEINSLIDVGGDGSSVFASAGSRFTLASTARLRADGGADGGDGGEIAIRADGDIEINGALQCRGSSDGSGGGTGGEVRLESESGDVTVRSEITTRSGSPDGDGGFVGITTNDLAGGSVHLSASGGEIRADGSGTESGAGEVVIAAGLDVILDGRVLASGGDTGGDVVVAAGRDVTMTQSIDARGRSSGSLGGFVAIDAGRNAGGDLSIQSTIDVKAGPCDAGGVCGTAGDVEIAACDVTVSATGRIDASAFGTTGVGGSVAVVARRQLRVNGTIDATAVISGITSVLYPSLLPPSIQPGGVVPPPATHACADCEGTCASFCDELCDCGNGTVDPFEGCDGPGVCVCGVPGSVAQCQCILNCGDGVRDPGEECDGPDLGTTTCESRGFPGGTPACTGDCRIDTSTCDPITCGDGTISAGEVCEPGDLNGRTCQSLGYAAGLLGCGEDCTAFDAVNCLLGTCGDGVRCFNDACVTGPGGGPEACDDGNNDGNDGCLRDCGLAICGDGVVCSRPGCESGIDDGPESCDDGNASNTDACLTDCSRAMCGDGLVCAGPGCTSGPGGGAEECDEVSLCCLSDCGIRVCTETGICDPTHVCCPPGVDCDDGNPCTTDACNPATGCTHQPHAGTCEDGSLCTVGEACVAGSCSPGVALDCDDGNPCTVDSCDPASGCVHVLDASACPMQVVAGKKITLKTQASKPNKNKLSLLLRGPFEPPVPGDTPVVAGASLRVRDAAGQDVSFDLPAASWTAKGSKFTYKDAKGRNGACRTVVFKVGKSIKVTCKGADIRIVPELIEPVQVVLRTGQTHYCTSFGGKVSKNGNGTFVAKAASSPDIAACNTALLTPVAQ